MPAVQAPLLAERWLRFHATEPERSPQAAAAGLARAQRYPAPVAQVWPWVVEALDRVAPTLLLGTPRRASSLDDAAFDQLEWALQHHPALPVRLMWLLLRSPLLEQRYREPSPETPVHPLDALAGTIRQRASHHNHTFDTVVIGSGAGGAPLAWSLARAGKSVCVVESGHLLTAASAEDVLERHFLHQGMVGSLDGGGTTLVLAGRAVGGTTVINSGTSLRPRPERLEAWDDQAGTDFADGVLDPWLDQVVGKLGIAPIPEHLLDASSRLVRRGLEELGRTGSFSLPRNAPGCEGRGRCCFGCPSGAKRSTDRAFLPEAIEAGATLLSGTRAVAIRRDAAGVELLVRTPEGQRRLRCRRLVLAAGALGTPDLLRDSRLGQTWKRAGQHLRIHPATKVFGMMPEALPHGGVPQALGYRAPELPRVTFEGAHTPPGPTSMVLAPAGHRHRWWMEHHEHLANYGLMVRDRSVGSVRRTAGQRVVRYALHPDDAADLGAGLLIAGRALMAAGAERLVWPLAGGEVELEDPAALDALTPASFPRHRLMVSGFHPQGTAGIGRVVDRDLQVIGTDDVFVCDASVLPDSPGVNPQVTIMALSLRLAARLADG